jgi:hypothetical protein
VKFTARKQNKNVAANSERNDVGLVTVTKMATVRNRYIYLFKKREPNMIFGSKREENMMSRRFMIYPLHTKYYSGGKMKEHKKGGDCGTPGGEEKYITDLVREPQGNTPLQRDVDRKIILKWILKKYGGRVRSGLMQLSIGTSGGLL